ncbi:hypothetical protein ACA910_022245 [Epithemia clementina (nom. ined.)]
MKMLPSSPGAAAATLFALVLLCCSHPQRAEARKCGTALTKECKATKDKRYDPRYYNSTFLIDQAPAWGRLQGLYSGTFHTYDPVTFQRILVSELLEDFTGTNEYSLSPSDFFVNLTVAGTRAYRHTYTIQEGRFSGTRPGRVTYCDSWSVATWDRNGVAKNFKTNCSDVKDGSITLLEESKGYPVDDYGLAFIEKFIPSEGGPVNQVIYTFTCTVDDCERVSFLHERYVGGKRTVFMVGDLTKVSEDVFTQRVAESYVNNTITERDQVLQPMRGKCLVGDFYGNLKPCKSERDFCQGVEPDPQCSSNPYQEPDGEVKPGVIVAFVVSGVVFLLAIAFICWLLFARAQMKRSREFFAMRMAETMKTSEKLNVLEFTPEEMLKEFKVLQQNANGELSKENMYIFLSNGPRGYMDYWDFLAIWRVINMKKNGTMDFLEFCSIMAHTNKELAEAKRKLRQQKEDADEEEHMLQRNLVDQADLDGENEENVVT